MFANTAVFSKSRIVVMIDNGVNFPKTHNILLYP